jgi:hypothetical protein
VSRIFVEGFAGEPGAVAELEIDLPEDAEPLRTRAAVIRAGAGLQFTDSTRAFRVRLDRYLAAQEPPRGWD